MRIHTSKTQHKPTLKKHQKFGEKQQIMGEFSLNHQISPIVSASRKKYQRFFKSFFCLYRNLFHPHSSVEYQQNKLSFMSSKSNRIFFITVTFSSLLVFEESFFRWSQRLFLLLFQRSAGIFIAIVPYTITRSSYQSHKNFCMKGEGRVCRREKCLKRMKEYNSYMFPFIWNKLNAMCSP